MEIVSLGSIGDTIANYINLILNSNTFFIILFFLSFIATIIAIVSYREWRKQIDEAFY